MEEQLNQKNVFRGTIYTKIASWTSVFADIREIFKPILKGYRCALETRKELTTGENYMELKLIDDTIISFSAIHNNEKANKHFEQLATFVTNMRYGENDEREKMLLKVLNFNYILSTSFEINTDNDRSEFIMTLLLNVTQKLDGYFFMTQKGVSTFLDGYGNKVFPKI